MWNEGNLIFDFQKEVIFLQIFFLPCPSKKKGAFFLCPFFALFFFRGFFFNPFFFCSASFCLFDNLSILSDCWDCLGCRQCRSNQKYTYRVPTLLQNIYIQPKIWRQKCSLSRALFYKNKRADFFCPLQRPFYFFLVRVPFFLKGRFFRAPLFFCALHST